MCGCLTTVVRASEPSAKWPKSKWDKYGLVYLFLQYLPKIRLGTKPESASEQFFYHFRWQDVVVYCNYIEHMAVEAEEALNHQTVRMSAQNIFLFTAFSRFKEIRNLRRLVKPKKRNHLRYCTDARARMETNILE